MANDKRKKHSDSYFDIDRMINEGLGGGFIHSKYTEKQMDLNDQAYEEHLKETNFSDCNLNKPG